MRITYSFRKKGWGSPMLKSSESSYAKLMVSASISIRPNNTAQDIFLQICWQFYCSIQLFLCYGLIKSQVWGHYSNLNFFAVPDIFSRDFIFISVSNPQQKYKVYNNGCKNACVWSFYHCLFIIWWWWICLSTSCFSYGLHYSIKWSFIKQ